MLTIITVLLKISWKCWRARDGRNWIVVCLFVCLVSFTWPSTLGTQHFVLIFGFHYFAVKKWLVFWSFQIRKETQKLREFEEGLVSQYKFYLENLEQMVKGILSILKACNMLSFGQEGDFSLLCCVLAVSIVYGQEQSLVSDFLGSNLGSSRNTCVMCKSFHLSVLPFF